MANPQKYIGSMFYQWLEIVSNLILTKSGEISLGNSVVILKTKTLVIMKMKRKQYLHMVTIEV